MTRNIKLSIYNFIALVAKRVLTWANTRAAKELLVWANEPMTDEPGYREYLRQKYDGHVKGAFAGIAEGSSMPSNTY